MLYDFFIFYAAKQRVERLRGCYDGDTIAALFMPSLWKKHTMQKNCAAGNLHAAGQIGGRRTRAIPGLGVGMVAERRTRAVFQSKERRVKK